MPSPTPLRFQAAPPPDELGPSQTSPSDSPGVAPPDSLSRMLAVTAGTSFLVTAFAWLAPLAITGTLVGLTFLGVTWWRVWSRDEATIRHHGLSLGGLMEPQRVELMRVVREGGRALLTTAALGLLTFPPFIFAWKAWYAASLHLPFHWVSPSLLDDVAGQVLMVALPEEAFFRGYVQTTLEMRLPATTRLGRVGLGAGNLLTSVIFALGHVLTNPSPARLAVFVPSLVFGMLRRRTGGIGASVGYHAACNLLSTTLARSWGLLP